MLLEIPTRIETERLYLRPYQAGDGPWYYAMALRNRAHLARYESGNAAMSLHSEQDAEIAMRRFAADWVARNCFFLGAFCKGDDRFVGQIYVGPQDWSLPSFVAGYFGDVDQGGQGYITEAARGALGWLFGSLGAHRVTIYCDDTNLRSARVAERCGFTREGHLRETHRHGDYPISGDYIYGLLRGEYVHGETSQAGQGA
jgi:RimJ/RimL family protein N-acetyltransferase